MVEDRTINDHHMGPSPTIFPLLTANCDSIVLRPLEIVLGHLPDP